MDRQIVQKFAKTKSFDTMGGIIIEDRDSGVKVYAGQIWEGKTVKGGSNLIVTLRTTPDGYITYMHGDKGRKTRIDDFMRAVMNGDIQRRRADEIDTERLSMMSIGLDALANRRTGEEQIQYMGDRAAERYYEEARRGVAVPLVRSE